MRSIVERMMSGELNEREEAAIRQLGFELYGSQTLEHPRALRAVAACGLGARPEEVAGLLDWREFESFCAHLLRTRNFRVEENVTIKRPRAQVDLLASSDLFTLAVDCKHWKREMGHASLRRCAEAQRRRARLLRLRQVDSKPIASVILALADEQVRFVAGAAVVPVRLLWSFIDEIAGYDGSIEFD